MERKGMGIVGALLGAVIGALPMVIVGIIGFFTGWLGIFTALGAYKGYVKFNGPKSLSFAKGTIIGVTVAVTVILSVLFFSLYSIDGMFFGSPTIFTIIPIFVGSIGYAFVDKKIQLYVHPTMISDSLEQARTESLETQSYDLYLPDMERLKPYEIGTRLVMLVPFLIVVALLILGNTYLNYNLLISILFAIFGWAISVILSAIKINPLRLYAFARTSDRKLYKINLAILNLHIKYQYCIASIRWRGFSVKRITPEEHEVLKASVYRAITDLSNPQSVHDQLLHRSIVQLKDLQLVKNKRNFYSVTYQNPNEKIKKGEIAKIYQDFTPFAQISEENKKLSMGIYEIVLSFGLTLVPFIVAFVFLNVTSGVNLLTKPNMSKPSVTANVEAETTTYEFKNISYKVPSSHQKLAENIFISENKGELYGVNGVIPIGAISPQDSYNEIVSQYKKEYNVFEASNRLSPLTFSDNVEGYIGTIIVMNKDDSTTFVNVIFVPDKNVSLSVFATSYDFELVSSERLIDTLTFQIGDKDFVSGNTFVSTNDQSELVLRKDGSYNYYQSQDDHKNNYYTGAYEVYYGQKAFDYVAAQTEYGLTREELESMLKNDMNGYILNRTSSDMLSQFEFDEDGNFAGINPALERYHVAKDTFYALVLKHEKPVISGTEQRNTNTKKVLYIGYYIPEIGGMELLNANELTQSVWLNKGEGE